VAVLKTRRRRELEERVARLEALIARAGGEELPLLDSELGRLKGEIASSNETLAGMHAELADLQQRVVETRETALLQEVAIYEYRHPLEDAPAFKARLAQLKDQIKAAVKADQAVVGATTWTVNGSAAQGKKMVKDFSKLLLRAYNNEADNLVRTMKPYKRDSSIVRLQKTRETIARLGKTMNIAVTDYYHYLRVQELDLTADHLAMVAEQKEHEREERERLREERKAMQEFKREEERLRKELNHRQAVLVRLEESGADAVEIERARESLGDVEAALGGVLAREANIRAGYVYVISNFGSFGPSIVKIGMTRRLEPMDRVNELGDASVPFKFDVHALIFSDDAVGLEAELHEALDDRRVNLINRRREYFYTTPAAVEKVVSRAPWTDARVSRGTRGRGVAPVHEHAQAAQQRQLRPTDRAAPRRPYPGHLITHRAVSSPLVSSSNSASAGRSTTQALTIIRCKAMVRHVTLRRTNEATD
jgi:hypothetical protein